LLFAWLMKFDPNYQAIPWLAERYETSPQGDVYTFHLRQGLTWSNGDPVTAHDFVWWPRSRRRPPGLDDNLRLSET